jgi:hypothetical protein
MKKCYKERRKRAVSYVKYMDGRTNGLVRSWVKHVIEEKIEGRKEVMGIRERSCKQLLDNLKQRTG